MMNVKIYRKEELPRGQLVSHHKTTVPSQSPLQGFTSDNYSKCFETRLINVSLSRCSVTDETSCQFSSIIFALSPPCGRCEICGFTCRQKASLNWHMKKHDAEASYQFSCSICSKKFEKKDSVVAHKAKSHPEVLIAEALAANGGSVIKGPTSVPEVVPETTPVLHWSGQPSVSRENQEAVSGALTPLQQVVLPLAPQTQHGVTQCQFLQLATHHAVQVAPEQQAPTMLHITTATPSHLSSGSHSQLLQLSTVPASTASPMLTVYPQSTLLTLSSVTTLAPQQDAQWGGEDDKDSQLPGEGELWNRVVVGNGSQDIGDILWEGNREMKSEEEGIVWESEKQVLLQCAEVQGESLTSRWTTRK